MSNVNQFLEMVSAQDPLRAAEFSLLYAIRNRIDQVTIALIIANIILFFGIFAVLLRP